MKRFLGLALLVALVVPAAVTASPRGSGPNASSAQPTARQLCKQQRQSMGTVAFRQLYAQGGSLGLAFQLCVAKQAQLTTLQAKNAAKACKAEMASMGVQAFDVKYGKNGNTRNAYGKCVSVKAQLLSAEQQQATLKAAKACKAERQSMGAQAFSAKYGTNTSKSNAFGKCVQKTSATEQGH